MACQFRSYLWWRASFWISDLYCYKDKSVSDCVIKLQLLKDHNWCWLFFLSGHNPVSDSLQVSDLYRSIATEQYNLASRLVNTIVNIFIEKIKFKMIPPMGKVSLPCYKGFTKFLVWPEPHAVSTKTHTQLYLHCYTLRLGVIMVLWQRSQSHLKFILVTMWCCHTSLVACMLHIKQKMATQ